jgi:hypothetical protein
VLLVFNFIGVQSCEFALSLRKGIEFGLLNNVGTVKTLRILGVGHNAFCIMTLFGSRGRVNMKYTSQAHVFEPLVPSWWCYFGRLVDTLGGVTYLEQVGYWGWIFENYT